MGTAAFIFGRRLLKKWIENFMQFRARLRETLKALEWTLISFLNNSLKTSFEIWKKYIFKYQSLI